MTSLLTRKYWIDVLREWAEARLSPPQFDECSKVLDELTAALAQPNKNDGPHKESAQDPRDVAALIKHAIEQELAWCQSNPDLNLSQDYMAGFVGGLKQALHFIQPALKTAAQNDPPTTTPIAVELYTNKHYLIGIAPDLTAAEVEDISHRLKRLFSDPETKIVLVCGITFAKEIPAPAKSRPEAST